MLEIDKLASIEARFGVNADAGRVARRQQAAACMGASRGGILGFALSFKDAELSSTCSKISLVHGALMRFPTGGGHVCFIR